jgi:diacylglycerol kinase family enzyme
MRALLVVNPRATTTSTRTADVIVQALSHELDLEITFTTHRGHGVDLGEWALDNNLDAVIALGGDGVVNEVLNGILRDGPARPATSRDLGRRVPALGVIPGGSANVFSRALEIPTDPVEATGAILRSTRDGVFRRIGLGHVHTPEFSRWFAVNAGLGIDARIIASMELQRTAGRRASPTRYFVTTVREFFKDRSSPRMSITRPGSPPTSGVVLGIVQNAAPWTYFGSVPVDPCPNASFETGLDLFALRNLGPLTTVRAATRMLTRMGGGSAGTAIVRWHDQAIFEFEADDDALVPIQIDGEGLGRTHRATFTSHPGAVLVMGSTDHH